MDLTQETTADALLFIAQTMFLPPKNSNPVLPSASMNPEIPSDTGHLWAEFNRSIASLCTLYEAQNDVFAMMILPSAAKRDQSTPLSDIATVERIQFLCANNWDNRDANKKDANSRGHRGTRGTRGTAGTRGNQGISNRNTTDSNPLRKYVSECIQKILVATENFETDPGKFDQLMNDFIIHVYSNGWGKFCGRMTKSGNRGERLKHLLQNSSRHDYNSREDSTPPVLPNLIADVEIILALVNKQGPLSSKDYVDTHHACTRVWETALKNNEASKWIINLRFRDKNGRPRFNGELILLPTHSRQCSSHLNVNCRGSFTFSHPSKDGEGQECH